MSCIFIPPQVASSYIAFARVYDSGSVLMNNPPWLYPESSSSSGSFTSSYARKSHLPPAFSHSLSFTNFPTSEDLHEEPRNDFPFYYLVLVGASWISSLAMTSHHSPLHVAHRAISLPVICALHSVLRLVRLQPMMHMRMQLFKMSSRETRLLGMKKTMLYCADDAEPENDD